MEDMIRKAMQQTS